MNAEMLRGCFASLRGDAATGIDQVSARWGQPPDRVLLSGQGEFAAQRALEELGHAPPIISLAKELGIAISRCAPAHALAVLSREAAGA